MPVSEPIRHGGMAPYRSEEMVRLLAPLPVAHADGDTAAGEHVWNDCLAPSRSTEMLGLLVLLARRERPWRCRILHPARRCGAASAVKDVVTIMLLALSRALRVAL